MAKNTDLSLRNQVMYSVYVRNHSANGDFKSLEADLDRIKKLGVDIIWLMPIHPIGESHRKGTLGCPYSISDYREINPELGNLDDFKRLIKKIHQLGMKCIIDVVYNHTSSDSFLAKNKPEYFYKNHEGEMANKIGDWTDVRDLDYSNEELWAYQIKTLKYWVGEGVDGFRCDVASLVPLDFWIKARKEVETLKPGIIWLAETVHLSFIQELRKKGFTAHSDSEIYQAFDITYDYDINDEYLGYLKGECKLEEYIKRLELQESIYPDNYVKLRFLENHDQPRSAMLFPELNLLKIWTAFSYFQKGAVLLYAGQEAFDTNTPSLFEKDPVQWDGMDEDFQEFLRVLAKIKKKEIFKDGNYIIKLDEKKTVVKCIYEHEGDRLMGIFNIGNERGKMKTDISDGTYLNLIDGTTFTVKNGSMKLEDKPYIFETQWEI